MKIFMTVAILFMGDTPMQGRVLLFIDAETCKAGRAEFAAGAKAKDLDVWMDECREVTRDLKPQANPKHRDLKSEVKS